MRLTAQKMKALHHLDLLEGFPAQRQFSQLDKAARRNKPHFAATWFVFACKSMAPAYLEIAALSSSNRQKLCTFTCRHQKKHLTKASFLHACLMADLTPVQHIQKPDLSWLWVELKTDSFGLFVTSDCHF